MNSSHIENILENFDFEKVRKTMKLLNWTWYDSDEIPTTYRLIESAREHLESAYNLSLEHNKTCFSTSGGFKAISYVDEEGWYCLELMFVLTEWDSRVDE